MRSRSFFHSVILAVLLAGSVSIGGALFARSASASLSTPSAQVTSFGPIESHVGWVRGQVVEVHNTAGAQRWIVRLETPAGVSIDNAELRIHAFMPESGQTLQPAPSAASLGGGRYEIVGLRFEPAGWWNVGLSIDDGMRGDSLAFNLIVPQRLGSKHSGE